MDAEEAAAKIESLHDVDAVARGIGVRMLRAGPGSCALSLTVDESHLGSLGQLHGGVVFTLADVAMSYAGNSDEGTSVSTHASIDWVDTAQVGDVLIAVATEHSRRGRSAIYDVEVRSEADDRLIATFRGNTLRIS